METQDRRQSSAIIRVTGIIMLAIGIIALIRPLFLASRPIAILLSLIFQTLLHQIEKVVKKPWLAVLILSVGILTLTVAIPLIILPGLSDQVGKLSSALPQYVSELTAKSKDLHEQYQFVPDLSQEISKLNDFLRRAIESLPLILTQALGITIEAFATVVLALYITSEPEQ